MINFGLGAKGGLGLAPNEGGFGGVGGGGPFLANMELEAIGDSDEWPLIDWEESDSSTSSTVVISGMNRNANDDISPRRVQFFRAISWPPIQGRVKVIRDIQFISLNSGFRQCKHVVCLFLLVGDSSEQFFGKVL